MSTTGTYGFDPELAECIDEAFERCGFSVEAIERKHVQSALRSIKFMLNGEWVTLGVRQWMIQQLTVDLVPGQQTFTLPAGGIDIFDMTFKRAGVETEVNPVARDVYFTKHKKDLAGRVIEYMLDKGASTKTCYIWPCGERIGDQLLLNYMREMQDAGTLTNTLQLPALAREAFVSGLAMHLSLKFKADRYSALAAAF